MFKPVVTCLQYLCHVSDIILSYRLPYEGAPAASVRDLPMSSGRMISYVSGLFSMPSWWMPDSCAKAFAPTMACAGHDVLV